MCVFMKKKIVIKKQPCGCLCFGAEGGTRSRGKPTPQTGKRRRVPAPCSWGFASGTCLHKAESPTEVIKKQRMLFCGAEGGTRTPMRLPSADFESFDNMTHIVAECLLLKGINDKNSAKFTPFFTPILFKF